MDNFKKSSSASRATLKIRVKVKGHEFVASGSGDTVAQQFQKFLDLVAKLNHREEPSVLNTTLSGHVISQDQSGTRTLLLDVFEDDSRSSALVYRIPPHRDETPANIILMLLLGYQELRQIHEVSATVLNQALARSSQKILRFDRVLKSYICERFVVKRGRGKGGYYRLTSHGMKKATDILFELVALLPSSRNLHP
ncbi:hypothetical protein [Nitrospira sp. M1]